MGALSTPIRALGAVALLLVGGPAARGEERAVDWSFEVIDVAEVPHGHVLRLKPMPPGRKFPRSCDVFVVHATFSDDDVPDTAGLSITRKQHGDAIRHLERARTSGEIVRFGSIGRGFAKITGGPRCEVASQGLIHIVKGDGRSAVFSVVEVR